MEGFKEANVTRTDDLLTISWAGEGLDQVTIYQAEVPDFDEMTGHILAKDVTSPYTLTASRDVRLYFLLVGANGARIRIAERVMPMDALVNFRDLGGYLTADGRRTKWGKLLRSAAHDAITDRDVAYLQKLGLKTVVDYRSTPEEADHPDRQIDGVAYLHIRPLEDPGATNILDVQQPKLQSVDDAVAMLIGINRTLANSKHANAVYRALMLAALDPAQVPIVQHCTAGKDRVGVGSATMLLALGVPRETIIADYLLSNDNQISASKLKGAVAGGQEVTDEQLKMFQALAMVRADYLQAFFDEIDTLFGGTEGYLKNGLGLTDDQLAQFQALYLETM